MKIWPARTKAMDGPVQDLDEIVATPVSFRFKGKIHVLKPFSLAEFLKFTNAQSSLMRILRDDVGVSPQELAEKYHAVLASICDTITIQDILSMEQVQIAALYQLVIDMVTGQVDQGDSKKKRKKLEIYESVEHSSSLSVLGNSDGRLMKP